MPIGAAQPRRLYAYYLTIDRLLLTILKAVTLINSLPFKKIVKMINKNGHFSKETFFVTFF